MRTFLWTCAITLFFAPLASAQDFEQLQKIIIANISAVTLDDAGRKPPTPEHVKASKAVFDAAVQVYALPNLSEENRQWTLQREAAALVILAYADTRTYYPRLAQISDELEQRGLPKIVRVTEKHVLEIGGSLVTRPGANEMNINVAPLAHRMVMYAEQFPGADSIEVMERFLLRIRLMDNRVYRDRRLAATIPVFQDFYRKINRTPRADALEPDRRRATLPGQPMTLLGVDINGRDFDPASVKDKVVLVQFWGTWCTHCKEEMPNLIAYYEKYRAAGFEIIGVNTGVKGDDEKKVKQFVETQTYNGKKIPWTILHETLGENKNKGMSMTKFYGIDELPVMILIGRNGKVLDLHPHPSTLDTRIAQVTSPFFDIEFTEEEKEIIKKQQEEEDRKIRQELSNP